jgi:hypothetical protein
MRILKFRGEFEYLGVVNTDRGIFSIDGLAMEYAHGLRVLVRAEAPAKTVLCFTVNFSPAFFAAPNTKKSLKGFVLDLIEDAINKNYPKILTDQKRYLGISLLCRAEEMFSFSGSGAR